jgi:hypothetical protein
MTLTTRLLDGGSISSVLAIIALLIVRWVGATWISHSRLGAAWIAAFLSPVNSGIVSNPGRNSERWHNRHALIKARVTISAYAMRKSSASQSGGIQTAMRRIISVPGSKMPSR